MKKFLIRLVINAIALYIAVAILNGHGITPVVDNWLSFVWLALIFGLINTVLKPLLVIMSCPLLILTLGLGTLLINTLLFYLAGLIGTNFEAGFLVSNLWAAFLGALIVSLVSLFLSLIFKDHLK